MLINLLLGFSTMLLCLFLQIFLLIITIRYYLRHRLGAKGTSLFSNIAIFSVIMLMLSVGTLGQTSLWGLLFLTLGEFEVFATAFYHSAVNFGSLGYGDIVMSEQYRLLGALEAINGVLMIGISTAALSKPFKDILTANLHLDKGDEIL